MIGNKISVIMPALNEERSLPHAVANVLDTFQRFSLDGELIIVNDGSSDQTGEVAEDFAGRYGFVRVHHQATPQGIGAAFRAGLRLACGELVVYIPGDGEIDAAEILRYVPLMKEVDLVVPYVHNPEIRRWSRRVLSACYTQVMNRTFSVSLRYLNGTVLYRKAILEGITIRNSGFFYQAELLIKTLRRNYIYAEVPYAQQRRIDGKSKSVTIKSLLPVVKGYFVLICELYFLRSERFVIAPLSITARQQQSVLSSATGKHP
ncbi:glycosyltransferase family 2 protein [Geobacter pelophilus]|uniref:Glycosyltransferase family 2 protein n=1 Tax=Geoanaerobacter pelophilus TaxID=60036 RepID=A0AAW4L8Q5_9BACT|nr:glycosyltransferase family 2 protein [Geoanaerobacter pelophilus]MBT0666527.1 glycosyltransferase family 2 protein [Geoanaerobacter pelophilus]